MEVDLRSPRISSITTFPPEILKLIFVKGCEDELHGYIFGTHARRLKKFAADSRNVCRTWGDIIDGDSRCFWVAKAELGHDSVINSLASVGKSLKSLSRILHGSTGADLIIKLIFRDPQTDSESSKFRLFLHGLDMLIPFQNQLWGIKLYTDNLAMHTQFLGFVAGLDSKRLESIDLGSYGGNSSEIGYPDDVPKWTDRNRFLSRLRNRIPLPLSLKHLPHLNYLDFDSPWSGTIDLSTTSVQSLVIDARWFVHLINSLDIPGALCTHLGALKIFGKDKVVPIGWKSEKLIRPHRPSLVCLHRLVLHTHQDDWPQDFLSLYSFPTLQSVTLWFSGDYPNKLISETEPPVHPEIRVSTQDLFPLLKRLDINVPTSWKNLELINLFSHSGSDLNLVVEMVPLEQLQNVDINGPCMLLSAYREILGRFRHRTHRLELKIRDNSFEDFRFFLEDFNFSLVMEMCIQHERLQWNTPKAQEVKPPEHQQNMCPVFPKLKKLELHTVTIRSIVPILLAFRAPELESLSFDQTSGSSNIGEPVALESPTEIPQLLTLRSVSCMIKSLEIPIIAALTASAPNVEELFITIEPYGFGHSPSILERIVTSQNECLERLFGILKTPRGLSVSFSNLRLLVVKLPDPDLHKTMDQTEDMILEFLDYRTRAGAHPLYLKDIFYPKTSGRITFCAANDNALSG